MTSLLKVIVESHWQDDPVICSRPRHFSVVQLSFNFIKYSFFMKVRISESEVSW